MVRGDRRPWKASQPFPGPGEEPDYNSVDSALWFIQAVRDYYIAGGKGGEKELAGAVWKILEGYRKRTAGEVSVYFYGDPATNNGVAGLAPDVLRLAGEGDPAAAEAVSASVGQLLALAVSVTGQLFPGKLPETFRAGVSGHILNHPFAFKALSSKAPFPLTRVTEAPIEGVRLLLGRLAP